ncbi:protein TonB [Ereboglobus sp. PH5-5]|uniref:energy transducer TonB n=1 Tax=Ereboglobus sp. PH5-5 TaxID=2940529 RepID=UPI0024058D79|nr:energy transducer TonB [Ereboglobus sp. PH5-5]MDF9832944.1 protein TonB [Ereboglobus sp. PH5-5]
MITRFIIPATITGTACAALFFINPAEQPPPPKKKAEPIVITFPPLPPVPPPKTQEDNAKPTIDVRDLKPPPMLSDTISTDIDRAFVTPFNPTIPAPNLNDGATMTLPTGNYEDAANAGQKLADTFRLVDLDNRPQTLFQASPEYPYTQKNTGNPGEVIVNFTVDERGHVQDVLVVKSSHPDFDAPTVRAVSKWRFEPGRKNGKRVKFRMSVPIAFNLNDV